MPFTLNVQFAGLCLFVQERKRADPGLFVLMTDMKMPDMVHYPRLYYDAKYAGGDGPVLVSLYGKVVNLRGLVPTGAPQKLPPALANASQFVERPVASQWTREPVDPTGPLLARIELDLGLTLVTSPANTTEMEITYGGQQHLQPMAGVGTVTIEVTDPAIKDVNIAGVTFTPVDGQIEVMLANLPIEDYSPVHRHAPHYPGEPSTHFRAFYQLLEGKPTNGPIPIFPPEPKLRMRRTGGGVMGEDPVICMMGGGCPEEEPDCYHP